MLPRRLINKTYMALFNNKKKEVDTPKAEATTEKAPATRMDLAHVLRHPRITEKATMHQSMSIYVFDVASTASKNQIIQAVQLYYKVRPQKVRIAQIPKKRTRNMRTGVTGATKKGKKAYVYLKKGETITLT